MRDVLLRVDGSEFNPGDLLTAAYCIDGEPEDLHSQEVSVLWHTEGKGDEDLGVIHFTEWSSDRDTSNPTGPQLLEVRLPRSPLSYDGRIVKVRWCVRVRARWVSGEQTLKEVPFQLGAVAPPPSEEP
jgi:hypothetical protein